MLKTRGRIENSMRPLGKLDESKVSMSFQLSLDLCEHEIKGKPLLKWPGGKRSLLKRLFPLLPQNFGEYYEPFVGGGALFFALQPKIAYLSDCNRELINCYNQVKDNPDKVINCLKKLKNSEETYYQVRDKEPKTDAAKAARLIYLTMLSFNGIYRINSAGKFNVPYGHRPHLQVLDAERIRTTSQSLQKTTLTSEDFEDAVKDAKAGDLVYLDPPYTVAHENNGFLLYNAKIFSWEDQTRLSKLAIDLKNRGCHVIISNADHDSISTLYQDFHVITVERASIIGASAKSRRRVTEFIFYS